MQNKVQKTLQHSAQHTV